MPAFAYEAASKDGRIEKGVIEAPDRGAAVERIISLGQVPVRVEATSAETSISGKSKSIAERLSFGLAEERLLLLKELSVLLGAGLSIERSLTAMSGLTEKTRTKASLQSVLEGLRTGEALSLAMRRAGHVFTDPIQKLVAAGEASGKLPEVVAQLAANLTRHKDLSDRIVSALIYPALLLIVMFGVLTLIFTTVLPQLEPLFAQSGASIPWPTALLLNISYAVNEFGLMLIIALIGSALIGGYALGQLSGRMALDEWLMRSRFLLALPKHYEAAKFCRNVSMLLEGGLTLSRALDIAQPIVSNSFARQRLARAAESVKHGKSLYTALSEVEVVPRVALEFVSIGEETGKLQTMLQQAAEFLDRDVQLKLERLSSLLMPAITIILGLVVAAIMGGVVSGIMAANELAV